MHPTQDLFDAPLAGRYAVKREVGEGAMATVYLAEDLKHERKVAVKLMRPELSSNLGPARFLREIRFAARLSHPHILALHDSGEADGLLFYVMPYIHGGSLRQRLDRKKRLPVEEALRIVHQVGSALAYAHGEGVVHRDIKPENILLHVNEALVADFGIARAIHEASSDPNLTRTGSSLGTPQYMSPEQVAGDGGVDGRSDIYALACVLYELLAGVAPFDGPNVRGVIARRLVEAPADIRGLRDDVPSHVAEALTRALSPEPEDRFPAPEAFLEALHDGRGEGTRPSAAAGVRSIAVLPFANMSADPDNEYFSDGITEDIINALAGIDGLAVAARTSCFAFKGKNVDVRTIGDQLGVATVLEGSVRKFGNRLRITAQLIDVSDGYHLWSEQFDREMEDVFAIQDEIAEAIVRLSTATLVGSGPKRLTAVQPARDFEAYNLYLKGRFQWNRRTNPAMRTALGNFEEALARDPGYAEAWAGVADCYTLLGWVAFGAMAPSEAFPPAEKAARRALELDPELAEAHKSLGWTRLVYSWDFDGAEKSFRRAIELRPRYAMAHAWYAMHLAWTDRLDEAVEVAARAQELEPLALIIHTLAGWVYYFARRYDDSIEQYRRTLELDPDYLRARLGLGWAYEQVGRLDDAIREFELGARLSSGSPRYSAALAHAYAVAGRRDEALSALAELEELSTWQYVSPSYIAAVHAGLEDADATFAWLERCFKERSGALVYMDVDPQMDTVRDDPRFDDIMRRVGLPGAG